MNVGKMGILDALDAATGEYLFSVDAGTQNVITAIDPKTGAKTIDPEKWPDPKRPAMICPGVSGARSWPPTSYSPQTTLAVSAADRVVPELRCRGIPAADLRRRDDARRASRRCGRQDGTAAGDRRGRQETGVGAPPACALLGVGPGHGRRRALRGRPGSVAEGVRRRHRQAAVAGRARRLAELEHHHLQRQARRSTSQSSWACATTTSTICRGRTAPSSRTEVRLSRRSGAAPRSGSSRSSWGQVLYFNILRAWHAAATHRGYRDRAM